MSFRFRCDSGVFSTDGANGFTPPNSPNDVHDGSNNLGLPPLDERALAKKAAFFDEGDVFCAPLTPEEIAIAPWDSVAPPAVPPAPPGHPDARRSPPEGTRGPVKSTKESSVQVQKGVEQLNSWILRLEVEKDAQDLLQDIQVREQRNPKSWA